MTNRSSAKFVKQQNLHDTIKSLQTDTKNLEIYYLREREGLTCRRKVQPSALSISVNEARAVGPNRAPNGGLIIAVQRAAIRGFCTLRRGVGYKGTEVSRSLSKLVRFSKSVHYIILVSTSINTLHIRRYNIVPVLLVIIKQKFNGSKSCFISYLHHYENEVGNY